MDAEDRQPGGHGRGHRIETSLLTLKKRASNYSSGGPGSRISAGGDPYASSSSKKKKRMADNSVVGAETKDTIAGALEAPVPRQGRSVPAAAASREPAAAEELPAPAPPAASPEPAAEGINALSSDEERWLSKGKWLAKDGDTVTPQQPPVKKLMHDGICSFVPQHQSSRRHAAAEPAGDVPSPLHGGSAELSEALRRRLAQLGATQHWLMHRKTLQKSDVDDNQNRLLVSCKRGGGGGTTADDSDHPITRSFSAAELARVNKKSAGLWVTALDARDGGASSYALTCKFLDSNSGYRFISEWKNFLIRHGMNLNSQRNNVWTRDVEVELWAFRSRRLPFQPQLDADDKVVTETYMDENGKKVSVVQLIDHHLHPDGAIGLILMLHENRRRVVKREEDEEEAEEDDDEWEVPSSPPTVARKKGKGKQQSGGKRGASASASASALAASPVALPAAPVEEQEWAALSESEKMFWAAVGLEKLRESILDEWQEYVGRGRGANKGFSNDVAKSPEDVAKSSADVEEDKIKKTEKPGNAHHKRNVGSSSQSDC